MRLEMLKLRNFKGVQEFVFEPLGADADILGDNGTGKTTLRDSFDWLLFGKDSQNRSDFEIKTLQANGQPLHNLEHSVKAILVLESGRRATYEKVYKEKWTKKRGSVGAEHTGHTTEHFIDGVPVKAGEYQKHIQAMMDEELFRLLTSPSYFNEHLHWQERRKILLAICGDLSDAQVIEGRKDLAPLAEILQHRSIEDHRKVLAAQRKEINRELERIPVRIDEVSRTMKEEAGLDPATIQAAIGRLEEKAQALNNQKEAMEQGSHTETPRRIRELEEQAQGLKWEAQKETAKRLELLQEKEQATRRQLMESETAAMMTKRKCDENRAEAMKLAGRLAELRELYAKTRKGTPPNSVKDHCPTCQQSLPTEKVAAAKEKAAADYNEKKAAALAEIQAEGKAGKARGDDLNTEYQTMDAQLMHNSATLAHYQLEKAAVKEEIALETKALATFENEAYQALLAQAQALRTDKEAMEKDRRQQAADLNRQLEDINQQIREQLAQLQEIENSKTARLRITELEAEEQKLADAFESLEGELYLTEAFIREKVKRLETSINSKFTVARFKLFDTQQNGGLTETCETTVEGVPYSSLNNAGRINAGLDILNTLSCHYGKTAPVFVDNAEAVTRLLPLESQLIRLVVSEDHPTLTVAVHPIATQKESA